MRTLAIGDVHGCADRLGILLDAVRPAAGDRVIFLGDLVDRGPDSAGVVRHAIRLGTTCRTTLILGNHEELMLAARDDAARLPDWLESGGDATLRSYGGSLADVPADHWGLLASAVDYVETDTHLFIHANAYPDVPMAEQPPHMLRWERCDRIAPHESGKTIVCGHTPQKSGRVMNRGYAICIDTNASRGGPLTCLDAGSGRVWQATADGRVERSHLSDYADE